MYSPTAVRLFTLSLVLNCLFHMFYLLSRPVKMSSPMLNMFILFGSIAMYASIFISALMYSQRVELNQIPKLCYVSTVLQRTMLISDEELIAVDVVGGDS